MQIKEGILNSFFYLFIYFVSSTLKLEIYC